MKPTKLFELQPNAHIHERFRPHGSYEVSVSGNVIESSVTGPLNLEAIHLYRSGIRQALERISTEHALGWLSTFRISMLMTPECITSLSESITELANRIPLKAVAHIAAADVEGRKMMSAVLADKIFRPANIAYQLFSDRQSAIAWLQQQLDDSQA